MWGSVCLTRHGTYLNDAPISRRPQPALLERVLSHFPTPLHKWALRGALDGFMGEATLWRDCQPTDKGRAAVDALRKVGE